MRVYPVVLLILACRLQAAEPKEEPDPKKWESEIGKFEEADRNSPPPKDAALFVDSSSFAKWRDIAEYFPDHCVINRGFGGSTLAEVNHYFDRLVVPYRLRVIVLYCGANDMAVFGRAPQEVLERFRAFVALVRKKNCPARNSSTSPCIGLRAVRCRRNRS
jgi:hypothetical protein